MRTSRRAVIDIGTNSIKLLVGDVQGRSVFPLLETSEQTRLGQGFYETRRLRPEAIQRSVEAVSNLADQAAPLRPDRIRVIATSAMREAANSADLIQGIQASRALSVEVISGEQEAGWAYAGVRTDPALAARPLVILDVGGGSTELIIGTGETPVYSGSFALGTVRLLERSAISDPPSADEARQCLLGVEEFLRGTVAPSLPGHWGTESAQPPLLVGTGGSSTLLARIHLAADSFDREQIEKAVLSAEAVRGIRARLWALRLSERRQVAGLPSNRADVILMGAAILEGIMRVFEFPELRVSTRGLRYAALLQE